MGVYECPNDGTFEAEPITKTSQSGYDKAVTDDQGNGPTIADDLANRGVALTREMWEQLATQPNPAWEPTYERVTLDDPVEHTVAVCPTCGTPVKVG